MKEVEVESGPHGNQEREESAQTQATTLKNYPQEAHAPVAQRPLTYTHF